MYNLTISVFYIGRSLFIEILPLSGSNPAALMVKDLIMGGDLSDFAARRAIAYVPFYLRLPSEKLLSSYEELLRNTMMENRYCFISPHTRIRIWIQL